MRALSCTLALVLGGCSAMGLDDFDLVRCKEDPTPCDRLNEELSDDQCEQYACSLSGYGCELRPLDNDEDDHPSAELCADMPGVGELDCDDESDARFFGNTEECDGLDNDCDGFIDEDTIPEVSFDEADLDGAPSALTYASMIGGPTWIATTQQDSDTSTQQGVTAIGDAVADKATPLSFDGDAPVRCAQADGTADVCNIGQLALAVVPDTLVSAGIHGGDCGAGQLRLGAGAADDFALGLGTPLSTNLQFGVDLNARSCTQSGACQGASDPALAALGSQAAERAQALAVWSATAPDDAGCEGESCVCAGDAGFELMALGAFVARDAMGRFRIDGRADGHAERLDARASGAPAIAAIDLEGTDDDGYVVAYPAADRVALRFIPRVREDAQLADDGAEADIDADGAEHVALAFAAPNAIAVVYREGGKIRVQRAVLANDGERAFELDDAAVTLDAEGEVVAGPSIVYASEGFTSADWGKPQGGFAVLWSERIGNEIVLRSARIAEAELRLLGEPAVLAHGASATATPFTYVKQVTDAPVVFFGYVSRDKLRVSRFTCPPPN